MSNESEECQLLILRCKADDICYQCQCTVSFVDAGLPLSMVPVIGDRGMEEA
jgi:hypothetical protein